ncbi:Hypothetical protein CINCED_3A005404 [Cinara cedri]|uniref:Uncharacterized protein n=1 Tax=Cinara cedri TaxID=506608 RepID=A0A5E4MT50_9HEMI|nr:Hypothetical protein CINCED_3A005404 [Cinara cedri]
MQAFVNKGQQETTQDLKNTISCQKEKLCQLMDKLRTHDEVVTERNHLRTIVKDFVQWSEKNDVNRKEVFTELLTSFEDQADKLKNAATVECTWQVKYSELQNIKDAIADELKNIKSNKRQLKSKLENAEKNNKCIQNELWEVKLECAELEDKKCIIEKLKANLKSNEEELCKKCKQNDDCIKECNQLKEANEMLELSLKCTKSKLDDAKLNATCAEEKWKLEREALSCELNMKCKELDELVTKVHDDEIKINKLMTTLIELKKASSKKFNELNNQAKKLQEEMYTKENYSNSLKKNDNKQLKR